MDNPTYIISASNINISETRLNSHTSIRRALRESINPLFSQSQAIKKLKAQYKTQDKRFTCPRCGDIVNTLDLAHIGEGAYTIIDRIMLENPTDVYEELANKVYLYHINNVRFAVVCRNCNHQVGDTQNNDN